MVNDMPPLKIRRLEGKDIVESSSSSAASDGSPLPHSLTLPPEVWANVIDCECVYVFYMVYGFILNSFPQ